MLVLLFLMSMWMDACQSQVVYNRLMSYDPRYMARPVRRSAMDALERLRLPATRYFPQVDTQAAPYPPFGYQLGDVYALPPQWEEEEPQEEEDYGNYDYEAFSPLYRSGVYGVYGQDPNDVLESMAEPKEEMFNMQRRRVADITTTTTEQPTSSTQQVDALVVPDSVPERDDDEGQKEEPLFRPLHNSQRTNWQQKSPIPLLKKMIQNGQKRNDPLLDQLTSLKKKA